MSITANAPGEFKSYTFKIWIAYDEMPMIITWDGPALGNGPALIQQIWHADGTKEKLLRFGVAFVGSRIHILQPTEIGLGNLEVRDNHFTPGKALQMFLYIPPNGLDGPPISVLHYAFKNGGAKISNAPRMKYDRSGLGLPALEANPGIVFYVQVDNLVQNQNTQSPEYALGRLSIQPDTDRDVRNESEEGVPFLQQQLHQLELVDLTSIFEDDEKEA